MGFTKRVNTTASVEVKVRIKCSTSWPEDITMHNLMAEARQEAVRVLEVTLLKHPMVESVVVDGILIGVDVKGPWPA